MNRNRQQLARDRYRTALLIFTGGFLSLGFSAFSGLAGNRELADLFQGGAAVAFVGGLLMTASYALTSREARR